ncbi:MAG TPA: ABC transporter permease [Terriglobales bacterium]|nr:ABC transporter permease [Terriglobales bacterium]
MTAINAMVYREAKIRSTNLVFIFWDVFYPLGYMLVFGVGVNATLGSRLVGEGVDYNTFFLASVLGMASFGIASNTSWSFFLDRDNGIFFEMLTYPLSRSAYMLGKVLFTLLVSLVQTIITVALAAALFDIHVRWDRMPLLFLFMMVGTAGWFFLYSIFALSTRRNDIFNTVTSILYFVLLFASNLFYPLEPLPKWFRAAARVNPITWQIDCLRWATIGIGNAQLVVLESIAFLVFAVAGFLYAARCLQRQQ